MSSPRLPLPAAYIDPAFLACLADGRVDGSEVERVQAAGQHVMTEVAEVVQRMKGMAQ